MISFQTLFTEKLKVVTDMSKEIVSIDVDVIRDSMNYRFNRVAARFLPKTRKKIFVLMIFIGSRKFSCDCGQSADKIGKQSARVICSRLVGTTSGFSPDLTILLTSFA